MVFRRLILWGVRRSDFTRRRKVVTFDGKFLFRRYEFLWRDEWIRADGKHFYRPPWYRPFNILLHCWRPVAGSQEGFHDHPRWSITICLKGQITEITPWAERVLRPGSIVIRSRKYIHAFRIDPEYRGKTWTLFIVGRRNHRQNTYVITKH